MIQVKNIQDITVANLKNGEVTLIQLEEIYNKFGFVFEGSEGKFNKIKREIRH
ncbi:MAG: hypothetical protein ACRCXA_08625 [Peptostreptococcaceae bacterium]